jgi:hypothetical protein
LAASPIIGALIVVNLGGRDWLPLVEIHLNFRQKGKTSSDSEEVGLAIVDVGGPIVFFFAEKMLKHLQNLKKFRPLS